MVYSNFKLDELVKLFDLTIRETSELFTSIPEVESSEHLITNLQETVDLAVAINTEKARSEMIIAPVLLELRRKLKHQISLFSGVDFTVDGVCDFIISKNPEQSVIYGVVTIGTIWRFLKLVGKTVEIDLSEYYIKDINKILGILYHAIINEEPGE